MCKCFPKSLLFFSTHSLFNSWSRKLKVHRVNSQTISSYPVRFSTDTDNINNIHCTQKMKKFLLENFIFCAVILFLLFFFVFFVFVFSLIYFVWNNIYIYSDTHSAVRAGKWYKDYTQPIFGNKTTFFA